MTANVPWSTLRSNPRDVRERAAAQQSMGGAGGDGDGQTMSSDKEDDDIDRIAWDVTEFGRRMALGGIVSTVLPQKILSHFLAFQLKPCRHRLTADLSLLLLNRVVFAVETTVVRVLHHRGSESVRTRLSVCVYATLSSVR